MNKKNYLQYIKSILPKFIHDLYYELKYPKVKFIGPYKNWKNANQDSTGYRNQKILNKIIKNTIISSNNDKFYERDGELLSDNNYPKEIIKFINLNYKKKLKLIDFGGSLGSFFFQNRSKIKAKLIEWIIYEQEYLVNAGLKNIKHKNIHFIKNIKKLKKFKPDIVLFSSVLEYLEKPKKHINEMLKIKSIKYIIIDRLIVSNDNKDKIFIQKNPKKYFNMSYPCRIFSKNNFLLNYFKNQKKIIQGNSYIGKNFYLNKKKISYCFFILKTKNL